MKDLKFKLLKILYELPFDESIGEADLLNPLKGKRDENLLDAQNALKQMVAQKYVSKLLDDTYRIAIPGITIYEAEHAARLREQASEKIRIKQTHHDWFIALFGILGGAVVSLITSIIVWWITGA